MKSAAINAWVGGGLALVPKGKGCQNDFRMVLSTMLKNALGSEPENASWSVADTVGIAVQRTGCQPEYDPALLSLAWPPGRPSRLSSM